MYQALYRKYRPGVFADVIGQPQVTKILAGEVAAGRLSHAYLFTGSRGTGKTSCARIFAKAVCCLSPKNGDPCGHCRICQGIDNGSMLDYSEMDAASNRSIEDIRRIREEAYLAPATAKYRIFVLDEVHMLTNEAFNALLKILEEPPEHVIFILATTDVQKLPGTILSRCQRFDFMRIEPSAIAQRLMAIAAAEGRELTPDAAALIAGVADGAMRDALSVLDRCMSEDGVLNAEVISSVVGLTGRDALFRLTDAVAAGDIAAAIRLTDSLYQSSCDGERLCRELLAHFRNYMIVKAVPNSSDLLVCTAADLAKYRARADKLPMETILYWIDQLSEAAERLKKSTGSRTETEMAIVRLCSPALAASADALRARVAALESELAALRAGALPVAPAAAAETTVLPEKQAQPGEPEAKKPPVTEADDEPMPPPFEGAEIPIEEADDEPMPPPFDGAEMPFEEADDEPMPPPFDGAEMPFEEADDEPMPPPFDGAEMPFGEADDEPLPPPFEGAGLPFTEAEQEPASGTEGKVRLQDGAFSQWAAVIAEAKRISPPMIGLVDGSSAVLNGNTLVVSSINPLFHSIVAKSEEMRKVLQQAIHSVTGKDLRMKIV